jgi:hypothetical protein
LILDYVCFLGLPKKQSCNRSMSRIGGVVVVLLGCILCESAQSTAPSEDEAEVAHHGSSSFILALIVAVISSVMLPLQACCLAQQRHED